MLDGRQPTLEAQAAGAIRDHAQGSVPSAAALHAIAEFQLTNEFFSSPALRRFARGGSAPALPQGHTKSEKRGAPFLRGCSAGSGQRLQAGTVRALPQRPAAEPDQPVREGLHRAADSARQRFISVAVSEFNAANNPVREFVFDPGDAQESHIFSPDPGRALITGDRKCPSDPALRRERQRVQDFGAARHRRTAPYFHDNSAKTLEDVAAHYAKFFNVVTGGVIVLTRRISRTWSRS